MLYLDANAFAKLYIDEDLSGQQRVLTLLDQHERLACSAITYAEVASVFARYFHEGKLDDAQYTDRRQRFESDWETVNVLDVLPTISTLAADLLKGQAGLRAMDALHLASALALRQSMPIRFLTFDARLLGAAQNVMPEAVV
jgi:uncharacterized protein